MLCLLEQITVVIYHVSQTHIESLNVLFKVERNKRFASFLPIYSKTLKLKASAIAEHLNPRITISEQCNFSLIQKSYHYRG